MLKLTARALLRINPQRLQTRSIFVVDSQRVRSAKQKKHVKQAQSHIDRFLAADEKRQIQEEERKYRQKMHELKSLTRTVSNMIKRNEKAAEEAKKIESIPMPSTLSTTSVQKILPSSEDKVYSAIMEPSTTIKKNALVVTPQPLPDSILDKLGLAVQYLVSPKKQNWTLVLQQLGLAGGFEDISTDDVVKFIGAIPPKQLKHNVAMVEEMLAAAQIKKTNKITTYLMRALADGSTVTEEEVVLLEKYCEDQKHRSLTKVMSRDAYEIMIQAYGKAKKMDQVNRCLKEMKNLGIEPSSATVLNILSTAVYKTRNHQHAVEIFDSMKFFSQSTKPSTRAYQDIIVSHINNDHIERALDLYQEMITTHVPINQKVLVALARGCCSRPQLRFKAWDFMFEVYNNGWTPTLETFEYMLYLLSQDGDLSLSRSLYTQLLKSNSTTPRSFSFLLLAYARCKISKGVLEPNVLALHEKGRVFRRNIIADTDMANLDTEFPFLPINSLSTSEQILAESSAVWAFTLLHNPHFVNPASTTTYLNIACEQGTLSDFEDRFNTATFLDEQGLLGIRRAGNETEGEVNEGDVEGGIGATNENENSMSANESAYNEFSEGSDNGEVSDIVKSPLLNEMQKQNYLVKAPRVSLMYVVALKAAGKFGDYDFAQKIWTERGRYRKTAEFRSLLHQEKEKLDFQFAAAMITCLTQLHMLEDALALLISTEYQFRWTWKELDILHRAALEIGHDKICKTVRGIARRAQIKFAGKIRRQDYKKYVMERGF